MPAAHVGIRSSLVAAAVACAVVAGVAVRVGGLFTEMWVDEIWTLQWGLTATSPINLVTVHKFKHDNNHPLNSAYIYLVGRQSNPAVYRLFSLACGLASIVVAWALSRPKGIAAATLSVVGVATCYQMAHYSSEARGYAPALLFVLLAWLFIERYFEHRKWYHVIGYWACAILGLLAHLTFVYAMAGFVLLTIARAVASKPGTDTQVGKAARVRSWLTDLAALHVVPLAFAYALWREFVDPMRVGGGPRTATLDAVAGYVAHVTGAPSSWALVATVVIAVLVLCAIVRQGTEAWMYFGALLAPVFALAVRDPQYVYARYFLICTPFIVILLARWLATWRFPAATAGVLVVWLAGQARLTADFIRFGRGHYKEAIAYMAANSAEAPVVVGSAAENGFRDGALVRFHDRGIVEFYTPEKLRQPQWLVFSGDEREERPDVADKYRAHYVRDRDFPFAGFVRHALAGLSTDRITVHDDDDGRCCAWWRLA